MSNTRMFNGKVFYLHDRASKKSDADFIAQKLKGMDYYVRITVHKLSKGPKPFNIKISKIYTIWTRKKKGLFWSPRG